MKNLLLILFITFCFFVDGNQVTAKWYDSSDISYISSSPVGGSCGGGGCYMESTPHITSCPGDNIYDTGAPGETTSAVKIAGLPVNGGTTVNSSGGIGSNGILDCFAWDGGAPLISDIGDTTPGNNSSLLAINTQNISFAVNTQNRGGSPVALIEGYFEDWNNANLYPTKVSSTSSSMNQNFNIQNVDKNRNINGGRTYSYKITNICDQALNCISDPNGVKLFTYNVYANSNLISTKAVTLNELNNGLNIADGADKNLTITLKDTYGNIMIPASGINRTIDLNYDVNNTLHLNQYLRTGDAVYLTTPKNTAYINRLTNNNSFDSETSTDGLYNFKFKVYTPTYESTANDGRELADGNFIVNQITYDINQNSFTNIINQPINNSNFAFSFKPIYKTQFNGQWITDGFIEGATQTGSLDFSSQTNCTNCGSRKLYLEFGSGAQEASSKLNFKIFSPSRPVGEGNGNFTEIINGLPSTYSYKPETLLLMQTGAVLNDIQSSYLSSHIGYNLDGKNIVYNSDVIGKNNYWGTSDENNITQTGLKIYGTSQSQNQYDLLEGQAQEDIHIIGKNDKAILKGDLRKNVYQTIKQVTPATSGEITELDGNDWSSNTGGGTKFKDKTILYFGDLNGGNIVLGDSTDELVEGVKTILIIGGNLYIKENMTYGNDSSILGIVVLKDENGKGGNVYIDPSVTKVVGTIFSDKSVISYTDALGELGAETTQSTLKNQLYIYGSLFTENTIGGSRMDPPVCPFYIDDSTCILELAQKYDLNYLRRYYLNKMGVPASGGTQVFLTPPNNKYPVIIEYNSLMQSTPPPLFQ